MINMNNKSLVFAELLGTSIRDAWENVVDHPMRASIMMDAYVRTALAMNTANMSGDTETGNKHFRALTPLAKQMTALNKARSTKLPSRLD